MLFGLMFMQDHGSHMITEQAVHYTISWFILPLWFAAGFADYQFHRRTKIEENSGVRESLVHHLMMAEIGLPLIMAAFFRINAGLIVIFIICLIAHEITGNVDIRYAESHGRDVSPTEEQVHSVLEILPLTAALLVILPHFGQAMALFGVGPEHADFRIALKAPPELWKILVTAGALFLLVIGPYTEETVRCLRAKRHALVDIWPAKEGS